MKGDAREVPERFQGHQESSPYSPVVGSQDQRHLGELLIEKGLISQLQLDEILRLQEGMTQYKPVGQLLVEKKVITRNQLNFFLDVYHKRPRLGEILLKTRAITEEQLDAALRHQKINGLRLGETLLKLGSITEEVLRLAIGTQLNIPFVDLDTFTLDRSLTRLINKAYAKKHLVVPVCQFGDSITLAMDDPTHVAVIEELQSLSGVAINVVTSTHAALERAFERLYSHEEVPLGEPATTDRQEPITERQPGTPDEVRHADEIVRKLIRMAINSRASDIHLQTTHDRMLIRFRIDGMLQPPDLGSLEEPINHHAGAIISRIKTLGQLDIAEQRRPQDGRFRARVQGDAQIETIDFSISVIPGYRGEYVVLRVLDPRNTPRPVHQLGFSRAINETLLQLLQQREGMILMTGPAGCGKSTTLRGALMTVYRPGMNILTAEDPIEYVCEQFTQFEVNERIGNTFATYLRAFLRHDPQVMMIGEIRDAESAELACKAAQTGHLVLSALRAHDAVSAVMRFRDLKIDPGLITSTLLGVLSQRLVRVICSGCKEEYQPSDKVLDEFFGVPPADLRWYKGVGCHHCDFTGYKGRMPVGELWMPNDTDLILINKGASEDEIRASSHKSAILMAEDVREKLREGRTNLEALIRALPYSCILQLRQTSS